jgi:hypothetical protein
MKIGLHVFLLLLVIASCKTKDEPVMDKISFSADNQLKSTSNTVATVDNRGINIIGTLNNGNSISIHVNAYDIGTYSTQPQSFNFTNIIYQDSDNTFVSFSNNSFIGGSIEINQLDTAAGVLSGTFEGILSSNESTIQITEGRFTDLALTNNFLILKSEFVGSVNGTKFSPSRISASIVDESIVINFLEEARELIEITVPIDIIEDEFPLEGLEADYSGSYSYLADDYLASKGSIIINNHDLDNQILYGSFNFTGTLLGGKETSDVICTHFAVSYF